VRVRVRVRVRVKDEMRGKGQRTILGITLFPNPNPISLSLSGKISPLQLLSMTLIELVLHSVNSQILMFGALRVTDLGGTYIDHMFGAYFGLSVSLVLGKPSSEPQMGNSPDLLSLIGTLFLWIYW
jgi:hypothetical protein